MNESKHPGHDVAAGSAGRWFHRLALATLVAVYLLILVGGIVRASGSGMGCPDWPQCFGRWVPPTNVSQLPTDYQQIYAERGYAGTEFNVVKTWTEYLNRLLGAVIGLLIFATMIASWPFRKPAPRVFWWSVVAFVLVGFQGWLGSVVVATNLATWMVTVHMLVALVLVGVLIYALVQARTHRVGGAPKLMRPLDLMADPVADRWFAAALALIMTQIALGTQVRERIDELPSILPRAQWIAESGDLTLIHRSFSLVVLAVLACLVWRLNSSLRREPRLPSARLVRTLLGLVVGLVFSEILAGVILFYFAVPSILQPVHMLVASALAGALFALWLLWRNRTNWTTPNGA